MYLSFHNCELPDWAHKKYLKGDSYSHLSSRELLEVFSLTADYTMISVNSLEEVPELLPFGIEWSRIFAATGIPDLTKCIDSSDFTYLKGYLLLMCRADIKKVAFQEAEDYVRRVDECCWVVLGRRLESRELLKERIKFRFFSLFGCIIPQLKYATALCFTKFWDHKEHPESNLKLLGLKVFPLALKQYVKRISGTEQRRRLSNQIKIFTLLQGFKKGCLPMRPHEVEKSLKTHKTNLSKVTEVDESVICRVREICRLLRLKFSHEMVKINHIPNKATIESSFARGGTVGLASYRINTIFSEYEKSENLLFTRYAEEGEEVSKSQLDVLPRPQEFLGFVGEEGKFVVPTPFYSSLSVSKSEMIEILPKTVEWLSKELQVIPAVILEPFKARIITKPNAGLYMHLTGLQKGLHSIMRKYSAWEAIGQPVGKNFFMEIASDWSPGKEYTSGDYSAATDKLKSAITTAICEILFEDLLNSPYKEDIDVAKLAIKTLVECKILTKDSILPQDSPWKWDYNDISEMEFDQENGQLMGNVLSFLILCIANYCCFHLAWEDHIGGLCRPFHPLMPKVKINGDDILFCSTPEFQKHWELRLPEFGFEKSMGKNYYSDKFMIVNSQMWIPQLNDNKTQVKDVYNVPYVNFGLLTGRRKKDCSVDQSVRECLTDFELYTPDGDLIDISKFRSSGRRYQTLHHNMPEKISELINPLWDAHQSYWKKMFGYCFSRTDPMGVKDVEIFERMVDETFKPLDHSDIFTLGEAFRDYPELSIQRKWPGGPNMDSMFRGQLKETGLIVRKRLLDQGIDSRVFNPLPKYRRM